MDRFEKMRYDALSADWHRLRDIEREWRQLRDKVLMVAAIVAGMIPLAIIAGWI